MSSHVDARTSSAWSSSAALTSDGLPHWSFEATAFPFCSHMDECLWMSTIIALHRSCARFCV